MIMLYYPKMPDSRNAPLSRCWAFEKYDGTNLHWDWDREAGWHRFGTRREAFELTSYGIEQFSQAHAHIQAAPSLFQATLGQPLAEILLSHANYQAYNEIRLFTEFFGPNSFAGLHKTSDPKELRLFDVWLEGYGFIGPQQFVADFASLNSARVVYEGKLTGQFFEDVRNGKFGVQEGVVCKGGTGGNDLWMVKIKTRHYQAQLKQAFAERWEDYWE